MYPAAQHNLSGWFDDLLQAGENIAKTIVQKPVYGGGSMTTYPPYSTPPMFPPQGSYYPSTPAPGPGGMLSGNGPLLIGAAILGIYLLTRRRGG